MFSRPINIICTLVVLISAFLLLSGSPILTFELLKKPQLPAGTLITAAGLICFTLLNNNQILALFNNRKCSTPIFIKLFLKLLLWSSILWLPVCASLAGNLNFNFGQSDDFQGGQMAMKIFWTFTYAIVLVNLVLSLIISGFAIFNVLKSGRGIRNLGD